MIDYIKRHERRVKAILDGRPDSAQLRQLQEDHDKQIAWMQHERLVHLIVMLFVCLFFLLSFGFSFLYPTLPVIALAVLLLGLSAAYILHYYRLENSVQRWYDLANEIRDAIGRT